MNSMPTISKSALKAKMFEYFRAIEKNGERLIVTDNGIPVLEVIPLQTKSSVDQVFGAFRGKARYLGDLLEPTVDEWGNEV